MHLLTTIEEFLWIENNFTMKQSKIFLQQYQLILKRLISIIIEVLPTEKKENIIQRFLITLLQLKQIQSILKHFIIEPFVMIKLDKLKKLNQTIKQLQKSNPKIFMCFITWEVQLKNKGMIGCKRLQIILISIIQMCTCVNILQSSITRFYICSFI